MRIDEDNLVILMKQLVAYVQDASLGDELKIISSGMEVRKLKSASQPLIAPGDARVSINGKAGEVMLR